MTLALRTRDRGESARWSLRQLCSDREGSDVTLRRPALGAVPGSAGRTAGSGQPLGNHWGMRSMAGVSNLLNHGGEEAWGLSLGPPG